ncbi:MAG TPA: DUF1329 domain-containing protein [Rudaea sp.]|jgi:hypothetical protein|nr:DUF1329 domain-containing protein [Rudaea sp.]
MSRFDKTQLAAFVACVVFSAGALAKGSPDDVKKMGMTGTELTPVGAERAGNKDGTIPEWTGGITTPPAGYKVGMHHPDPFASDKPKFEITAKNYKDYGDKLSAGQIAMFEKYTDWKMVVYPTHRSASFPQRIYDYSMKNAATGELVDDGEGVDQVAEGFPFPILDKDPAKAGMEAIWNHKLKFKGVSFARWNNQAIPTASGQYTLIRFREEGLGLYYKPGNTLKDINNILLYFFEDVVSPPRLAGQVLLVHETLDSKKEPRQAWVYNPGQRRVRRAPNIAYDNPGTASDGLRTNDMTDMFNGALDKFNWKLVGKKEMYVPYNSYKAHSDQTKVDDLIKPHFINPDLLRYELHRVWIVEADLKPGQRHINPKRTFYLDEDSWQILEVDHYDTDLKLWRYSEAPSVNYYEVPVFWSTLECHYDLKSSRYLVQGLDNQEQEYDFSFPATPDMFSPQALRQRGVE